MNERPGPDGATPAGAPMRLRLADGTASLAPARDAVAEWMTEFGAAEDDIHHAVLVSSELLSNAIEASPELACELTIAPRPPRRVDISVTNRHPSTDIPDHDDWGPDDPLATKGRGLAIVEALSDAVSIRHTANDEVTVAATLTLGASSR